MIPFPAHDLSSLLMYLIIYLQILKQMTKIVLDLPVYHCLILALVLCLSRQLRARVINQKNEGFDSSTRISQLIALGGGENTTSMKREIGVEKQDIFVPNILLKPFFTEPELIKIRDTIIFNLLKKTGCCGSIQEVRGALFCCLCFCSMRCSFVFFLLPASDSRRFQQFHPLESRNGSWLNPASCHVMGLHCSGHCPVQSHHSGYG